MAFLQFFLLKPCTHCCSLTCVLHGLPVSSSLTWSFQFNLTKNAGYVALLTQFSPDPLYFFLLGSKYILRRLISKYPQSVSMFWGPLEYEIWWFLHLCHSKEILIWCRYSCYYLHMNWKQASTDWLWNSWTLKFTQCHWLQASVMYWMTTRNILFRVPFMCCSQLTRSDYSDGRVYRITTLSVAWWV